jgi:hypothetical protein
MMPLVVLGTANRFPWLPGSRGSASLVLATLAVASGAAGCGESDDGTAGEDPTATARVGESREPSEQAKESYTKPPRRGANTDREGGRRPGGGSRPAPNSERALVAAAIHRYLLALNSRDLNALCTRFARSGGAPPPACQSPGAPAPPEARPAPQQAAGVAQIALRAPPRIVIRKGTAQATVELVAIGRDGTRSVGEEAIALRRGESGWVIASPSPIFARMFSGREPRTPGRARPQLAPR